MKLALLSAALLLSLAGLALAQSTAPPAPPAKVDVEICHIAPGQQEAFLRFIARCDDVNRAVGLPPRQLYVHSDGADWDYRLIQPAGTPPDKAALDVAWARSGLPSGADLLFRDPPLHRQPFGDGRHRPDLGRSLSRHRSSGAGGALKAQQRRVATLGHGVDRDAALDAIA